MKTIETKVYTFDELSDKAKEKARDWYREGSDDYQFAYNDAVEDAAQAGLVIKCLDARGVNEGAFTDDAITCAQAIIDNHGEQCATYKTAKAFLLAMDSLNVEYDEKARVDYDDEYQQETESLEKEFLQSLLKDYLTIYESDCVYRSSDEFVDETIAANEYTFTEDGKRFG